MVLNLTVGALLIIQYQVSSIPAARDHDPDQHRPLKSDNLSFTPQEELNRFRQRQGLLYRNHRAARLQDDILRGGTEHQFANL